MLAMLVALILLVLSAAGVYLLLKGMGQDGVEAAAPGSCKSGRCGVQPRNAEDSHMAREQYVRVDEIQRIDSASNSRTL